MPATQTNGGRLPFDCMTTSDRQRDDRSVVVVLPDASSSAPDLVLNPARPELPDVRFADAQGNPTSLAAFRGRVVLLNVWATWCPPCREEIPGYIELANKYAKDGLVIVGVSLDQAGVDVVKAFAARSKITYPLVMGDDAAVTAFGGVEALPTTFLIDRDGQVRDRKVGMVEKEDYEKRILAVLKG